MTQDDKWRGRGLEWSEKRWHNLWTAPNCQPDAPTILKNQVVWVNNKKIPLPPYRCFIDHTLLTLHKLTGCDESCISWVSAKGFYQCLTCLVCIIGYDQSSKYGASNIQQFRKNYAHYWLQYLTNSCFTMKKSYNYMVEISW